MNTRKADGGSAEIIGFVLIIALIVSVASVWILIYLPNEGYSVETDHARLVTEQFADLKYGIDLLWITGHEGVSSGRLISPSPIEGTEISGLLFLSPPVGTGTITVGPGTIFTLTNVTSSNTINVSSLKITYNSANYYAPDIRLVYDGGAVFRGDKDENPVLILPPSIGDDRLVLVNISSMSEQQILGNIPLSLTYTYKDTFNYDNVTVSTPSSTYSWYNDDLPANPVNVTVVQYDMVIGSSA